MTATMKEMPIGDASIEGTQDKPYSKKTTWGIAGSLRDLFSGFFGPKENNN